MEAAIRTVGAWMVVWEAMVARGEIFCGWDRGVERGSGVGGRVARCRDVERRRAGVSTRRIRGVGLWRSGEVVVGWI